jgi:hypothetical protein
VEEAGEGEEVKMEGVDGEKAGETKVDEEEDEDDEVPYIEDVGTREVAGFIVMCVSLPALRDPFASVCPSFGEVLCEAI